MRKTTWMLWTLLIGLGSARAVNALDQAALIEHVRETYRFPAGLGIKLGEPKASEVTGFDVMDMTISRGQMTQNDKLYVSKDGRYYIVGGFKDSSTNPDQDRLSKMDVKQSAFRGPAKAPVTVVQYTDFQCPYCQRGYEIMNKQIMKEYPGKVRWVYKSLPLNQIHPWAQSAAVAAECAKEQSQDKFWAMHDKLFESQREINTTNIDQKVQDIAKLAKVSDKPFQACYDAKKTLAFVEKDANEAEELGINGTPAFVVNGHLVSGGADYNSIKTIIEEALKGKHGKI